LAAYFDSGYFASVYFRGMGQVYATRGDAGTVVNTWENAADAIVFMQVWRVGNTINAEYCQGTDYLACDWSSSPLLTGTVPGGAGAARIGLFLLDQLGDDTGQALSGDFDALFVQADVGVPEPTTVALIALGLPLLLAVRRLSR
jgi:hypothetical protein